MYPRHYFDLLRPNVDEKMVFVGMSFAKRDVPRWDKIIRPAIIGAGMEPYRVDTDVASDSILDNIMQGILDARLLLFDISATEQGARNGNVMYEIGLSHAMRHPEEILIIRSDAQPLLFDVSSIRIHTYDENEPDAACEQLARMITHSAAGVRSLKGIILDKTISSLDEVCLGLLAGHANMPYFSLLEPGKAFEPETVAGRAAIRHLLDLGILSLVWKKEEQSYAYIWTFLGRAVLQHLGFVEETGYQESQPGQQLYNYQFRRGKEQRPSHRDNAGAEE